MAGMTTRTTKLGAHGPEVFPLALGCMGLGGGAWYGARDDAEGVATIHAAIERGVNVLDTGDFYGMGKNELLVGRAIADRRDRVLLSVKYGALRGPDGAFLGADTSPNATRNFLAHSLTRLGVDCIDIYRPARLDPRVPIEETIGALAELVTAGYIRHISLSEVGAATIARAAAVHPLCDLQIEYALISRGPEATILPALRAHGMAMTAYGVLSRGLLTGSRPAPDDLRAHLPRFSPENAAHNQPLVDALHRLAAEKGVTPAQLAIAWVRAKGAALGVTVIPTIGARTPRQLLDAVDALAVELSPAEVAALEVAVPADAVAGARYPAPMMAHLDSER
jgi:aryl-alcohol dehydrogenase-like predicted oxidoreductase